MKQHSEKCANKHKAVSCLQNGVSDVIFTRTISCETPKQAWDKLKEEFQDKAAATHQLEKIF
ncbi:pleiotropic drug resistance protein 3-like [Gossypium australe]|uniref:Pleiotropic drug resistance protein 3-like n=1 Tax=Gossypium australe TaxID=47621 RepID=A0A5B6W6M7_9ROSI|nr:pleiotropic drug resistance protein 3-like [Gossypium australe]